MAKLLQSWLEAQSRRCVCVCGGGGGGLHPGMRDLDVMRRASRPPLLWLRDAR